MHAKEIKATPPEKIILQVEPISVRIEQAAEMMGTSEDTLRKWIRKAGFPYIRVGRRIIVPVSQMRHWADENTGKTIEDLRRLPQHRCLTTPAPAPNARNAAYTASAAAKACWTTSGGGARSGLHTGWWRTLGVRGCRRDN